MYAKYFFALLLFALSRLLMAQCHELSGSETWEINGRRETFQMYPVRFNSAEACATAKQKFNSKKGTKTYSVSCSQCAESERTQGNYTSGNNKNSDGTTSPKVNTASGKSADNCDSRTRNIQQLKEKQKNLQEGDEAIHSVLTSAINQMALVGCGIVLNNVECRNNNCNFEWSAKESNLSETQAQASVQRFYQAVAKEEKSKAEANKAKAELVQLGAEAIMAIIDAIDRHQKTKETRQQSTGRLTPVDNDKDGYPESLVEDAAGGGQNLYLDTNGDGRADKIARIDKAGKVTYENIPANNQFSMQERTAGNASNTDWTESLADIQSPPNTWEDFFKNQNVKPGDDGFMTIIAPKGETSAPYNYQSDEKTYFINGIQNQYNEAVASAQLLANAVSQPVVQFYSAEENLLSDLHLAGAFRLGYGSTDASKILGQSLIYDLMENRQVTLYAHSRGAAISYQLANDLSTVFQSVGAENKLRNLTIVTVGGFAPAAVQWPANIHVVTLRHENDPIPQLGGNGWMTESPNHAFHSFESYLNEIVDYNFSQRRK